eukprot:TRINITY_DN3055_c1_g1_i1.p1 TRINITY_DN3055_c1_g1~~TRINITY_DN3055_c1_g1_i1.p1  ORF type:complete len:269 (+),score=-16.04 TRINITY_DN3055_c1_g1_i1:570-1376(+)
MDNLNNKKVNYVLRLQIVYNFQNFLKYNQKSEQSYYFDVYLILDKKISYHILINSSNQCVPDQLTQFQSILQINQPNKSTDVMMDLGQLNDQLTLRSKAQQTLQIRNKSMGPYQCMHIHFSLWTLTTSFTCNITITNFITKNIIDLESISSCLKNQCPHNEQENTRRALLNRVLQYQQQLRAIITNQMIQILTITIIIILFIFSLEKFSQHVFNLLTFKTQYVLSQNSLICICMHYKYVHMHCKIEKILGPLAFRFRPDISCSIRSVD